MSYNTNANTPSNNFSGSDSFTFRAYDGTSVEGTTYTMTISVNAAPVAVSDTASITAGDSDATGNVITNDTDSDDATSVMAIRGVGSGAESSTLANSNVGSAVSGTYGDLTITDIVNRQKNSWWWNCATDSWFCINRNIQ